MESHEPNRNKADVTKFTSFLMFPQNDKFNRLNLHICNDHRIILTNFHLHSLNS